MASEASPPTAKFERGKNHETENHAADGELSDRETQDSSGHPNVNRGRADEDKPMGECTVARVASLRGEWHCSRATERLGESGEHDRVGVQPDALDAAHADRGEAEVMLQESELALDGGAAAVEAAPRIRAYPDA